MRVTFDLPKGYETADGRGAVYSEAKQTVVVAPKFRGTRGISRVATLTVQGEGGELNVYDLFVTSNGVVRRELISGPGTTPHFDRPHAKSQEDPSSDD